MSKFTNKSGYGGEVVEDSPNSSSTSLKKFAQGPKIRLSKIYLNEIKEVFEIFDKSGCGKFDVRHLKVALRALGFDPKTEDINALLAQIDKKGAKFLSESEFGEIMAAKLNDKNSKSEISRAFKLFDDDDTGKISFENLRRVSQELGENLEDEELREMIEEADLDGDGEINEQEFARVMKRANLL